MAEAKVGEKALAVINQLVETAVADRIEARFDEFAEKRKVDAPFGVPGKATQEEPAPNNYTMAKVLVAHATAEYSHRDKKLGIMTAEEVAEANWPGDERVHAALTTTSHESGGVFEDYGDIIDHLAATAVVRKLGAEVIPMPTGSLTRLKSGGVLQASYLGETQPAPYRRQTFEFAQMQGKELAIVTSLSKTYLKAAAAGRMTMNMVDTIEKQFRQGHRVTEDFTFVRAKGTKFTPKGIRYRVLEDQVIPFEGDLGFENTLRVLGLAVAALANKDVPIERGAWIMNPACEFWLKFNCITDGKPYFLEEMKTGTLLGFPFGSTTQNPRNLAHSDGVTPGTFSDLMFVDMNEAKIGETYDFEVDTSEHATITDDNGKVINLWQQNMVAVKGIARHDFDFDHDEAIAVVTDLPWGQRLAA